MTTERDPVGSAGAPADNELAGVARDASSITDVLGTFEREGFDGQFVVRSEGTLECVACRNRFGAAGATSYALRRLEGASDPDDMLAVAALGCPNCGALGTVVLGYGPSSSAEDAGVLDMLDESPAPAPADVDQPSEE